MVKTPMFLPFSFIMLGPYLCLMTMSKLTISSGSSGISRTIFLPITTIQSFFLSCVVNTALLILVPPGTEGSPPPNSPYISIQASTWDLGSFPSPFTTIRNMLPNLLTPAPMRTNLDSPLSPVIDPSSFPHNAVPVKNPGNTVQFADSLDLSKLSNSDGSDQYLELAAMLLAHEDPDEESKDEGSEHSASGDGMGGDDSGGNAGGLPVDEDGGNGRVLFTQNN